MGRKGQSEAPWISDLSERGLEVLLLDVEGI